MSVNRSEHFLVESLFKESINLNKIKSTVISRVEKLTGDASTRRYYRVITDKESYVVCLAEPSMANEFKSSFATTQKILNENNVSVPIIFDQKEEKGYYLEEDLSDLTLLSHLSSISSEDKELKVYKEAIDLLTNIHKIDPSKYSKHEFTSISFDVEKLMSEVFNTNKYFLNRYLGANLSTDEASIISKDFTKICKTLNGKKQVVTHRDFHSRNLMIKNNKIIAIDFQDMRMGPAQYDLASLLEDCYYQLRPKNVELLKEYYLSKINIENLCHESVEEFNFYYDLMTVQRVYKAIGSFSMIFEERGDKRYLKYIGFAFEKIRLILDKYPEYNKLKNILSSHYYEN